MTSASRATEPSRPTRTSIDVDELDERGRRLLRMFLASMFTDARPTRGSLLRSRDCDAHPQVRSELIELLDVLDTRVDHLQPDAVDIAARAAASACPLHPDRDPSRVQRRRLAPTATLGQRCQVAARRADRRLRLHARQDQWTSSHPPRAIRTTPSARNSSTGRANPRRPSPARQGSATSTTSERGSDVVLFARLRADDRALLVSRARPRTYDMSETVQSPSPGDCIIASRPTCTPRSRPRLHRAHAATAATQRSGTPVAMRVRSSSSRRRCRRVQARAATLAVGLTIAEHLRRPWSR